MLMFFHNYVIVRCQDFGQGQLSNCNSLLGLNLLTNQILNKNNNNLIYILIQ
jgi:hypothetical protein